MTIISHKHKFIFLKSRKTAGTSVSVILAQLCGPNDVLALSQDVVDIYKMKRQNVRRSINTMGSISTARHAYMLLNKLIRACKKEKSFNEINFIPVYRQHMDAREIKEAVGKKKWNDYYKFTIERNPYDRLVSFYKWRTHWFGLDCTFEDFAFSLLTDKRKYGAAERGFYNRPFYTLDNHNICVDKVILYERLRDDVSEIFKTLNFPVNNLERLPKLKSDTRSQKEKKFKSYYTNDLLSVAKYKFHLEEYLFGYRF